MNKTTLNSQKEKHSMLSLRRATPRHRHCTAFRTYFYPRSPCGERPVIFVIIVHDLIFLSTLSLRRATPRRLATVDSAQVFLSTLSLRRATRGCRWHSLRNNDFYPRSPCGERQSCARRASMDTHFYPRSPCGERHYASVCGAETHYFYPRPPCGERPQTPIGISIGRRYFYPRPPCGERHCAGQH